MKLHLGCGENVVDGWTNVDNSLGARLAKIPLVGMLTQRTGIFQTQWDRRIFLHDLTTRFPWKDGSADAVYCSHTLEHFSRQDGAFFLEECFRVLRPGGVIRTIVPDLQTIIADYSEGGLQAENFLEALCVLPEEAVQSSLKKKLAPFIQFPHKCMYDSPALLRVMTDLGYRAESRAAFDSGIPAIEEIEQENRTVDAVIVEGVKP